MRAAALMWALLLPAAGCEDADEGAAARPAAAVAAPRPRSATQIKDCRDQCEQSQIAAGHSDDAALRECRARCAGSGVGGGASGPHEVPRSISRAPSLSAPPPVRPIRGSASR